MKQKKEKDLLAFVVTYYLDQQEKPHGVAIVAFDEKEAIDMFVRHAKVNGIYERINGVVCQKVRRTKENASMRTMDFYKYELSYIENQERKKYGI